MSSRATTPSYVVLPAIRPPYPAIVDFLVNKYPRVGRQTWVERLESRLITDDDGNPVTPDTPYRPRLRLLYYREVPHEEPIPFAETILYQDDHILVADKPHFLPVIPSGGYVNECLLSRLRARTGNVDLVPVNRLDRETAGVVLFSVDPATRGKYGMLFQRRRVRKIYEAVGRLPGEAGRREWLVETRVVKGEPWFRSANGDGVPNSRTLVWLLDRAGDLGYFLIDPVTGQNHQIRLHMCAIGGGILNDALYPDLWPERKQGFDNPLQLVSRSLEFEDPVTHEQRRFVSTFTLNWPPKQEPGG